VEPGSIGTIRVVETIKEGQPVYKISTQELGSVPAEPAIGPESPHNHGDPQAQPKPLAAPDRAMVKRLLQASQTSQR